MENNTASQKTALDWSGLRGLFAVETYNAGSVYGGYTERAPLTKIFLPSCYARRNREINRPRRFAPCLRTIRTNACSMTPATL